MKRAARTFFILGIVILWAGLVSCSVTPSLPQVATPVLSPASGPFDWDMGVTITCPTSGATIYFTTNGNTPSESSMAYTGAIPVVGDGKSITITTYATAPGLADSETVSGTYSVEYPWFPFPASGSGPFSSPGGIAVDAGGGIYVANSSCSSIVRVTDMYGSNMETLGGFNSPNGLTLDSSSHIYVADTTNHFIVHVDNMTGDGWETHGAYGPGTDQFDTPSGIAVDYYGAIYIADTLNNRIVRMADMSGSLWTSRGAPLNAIGSGYGEFYSPRGIAVDSGGRIYVADTYNNRIARMDDISGVGWTTLGGTTSGSDPGQFFLPGGIALDSSGRIYVADTYNNRIVKMNDMSGSGWTTFGAYGTGPGQFIVPGGIALDSKGRVYVADTGNYRIVRVIWD
jgi:sugar lactone lactonase YvrE